MSRALKFAPLVGKKRTPAPIIEYVEIDPVEGQALGSSTLVKTRHSTPRSFLTRNKQGRKSARPEALDGGKMIDSPQLRGSAAAGQALGP